MADNAPGEKTEDPTPKRKREAREEGQVAKSQELGQAFTLMGGFIILFFIFQSLLFSLQNKVNNLLSLKNMPSLNPDNTFNLIMEEIVYMVKLVGPIMGTTAILGLVINFIQVGPIFSLKSIQPKMQNIDPISGLKNIFSLKTIVELIKSLMKFGAIVGIAYYYLINYLDDLVVMPLAGLHSSLSLLGSLIFRIGLSVIIFLIFLGVADYAYQRWEHFKNLKMSKYEVKQERKEREGDPQIKQKRKEKQRQMSVNRMMSDMEDADVVITNPIHVAVALKYDLETMEAPVVLAKGEGYVAQRIKDKARELKIEIVENKPLAHALNENSEIGEEIPAELYQAVAEVLAYIYRKNKDKNI